MVLPPNLATRLCWRCRITSPRVGEDKGLLTGKPGHDNKGAPLVGSAGGPPPHGASVFVGSPPLGDGRVSATQHSMTGCSSTTRGRSDFPSPALSPFPAVTDAGDTTYGSPASGFQTDLMSRFSPNPDLSRRRGSDLEPGGRARLSMHAAHTPRGSGVESEWGTPGSPTRRASFWAQDTALLRMRELLGTPTSFHSADSPRHAENNAAWGHESDRVGPGAPGDCRLGLQPHAVVVVPRPGAARLLAAAVGGPGRHATLSPPPPPRHHDGRHASASHAVVLQPAPLPRGSAPLTHRGTAGTSVVVRTAGADQAFSSSRARVAVQPSSEQARWSSSPISPRRGSTEHGSFRGVARSSSGSALHGGYTALAGARSHSDVAHRDSRERARTRSVPRGRE